MNPQFPLYIVSKGRWQSRLTSKALERMCVPHYIVIEKQEYDDYAAVIDKKKILVLDPKYQRDYDTCDDLGQSKSVGPGAARNFVWDHAIAGGYDWHWVMDDNITAFCRFNKNDRPRVTDGTIFRCMEDYALRYINVAMAGPNYLMFVPRKYILKPVVYNTRIYSCNLIRNDVPFRWRGRYNEDTILSLDMLKANWCTVQFNAFLQNKIKTQSIGGGNTAEFYAKEGTMPKSQLLRDVHGDVARVIWKYKRWHHYVDYKPFQKTPLVRKPGLKIKKGTNNYGMVLKTIGKS